MRIAVPLTLLAALILGGCTGGSQGAGQAYSAIGELNPSAKIPSKANLKIGEINMEVAINQKTSGDNMTLELEAHGQTFETENYSVNNNAFELIDVADEHYEPNLPLLKFPMRIGDKWEWKGTMTSGQEPHNATAVVTSTSDSVLLPGSGTVDTVLVVVDLSIDSGGPTPATRKLRFWFAKDKGLIKRQFGTGSSREPAE